MLIISYLPYGVVVGEGEGLGEGLGDGLGVGLGLALALGVGVGVVSGVGLGDGLGLGLVKITFMPSSGTGETTFFCPTINQPKRITSKTITNPATK